jgi:hypothetical protein
VQNSFAVRTFTLFRGMIPTLKMPAELRVVSDEKLIERINDDLKRKRQEEKKKKRKNTPIGVKTPVVIADLDSSVDRAPSDRDAARAGSAIPDRPFGDFVELFFTLPLESQEDHQPATTRRQKNAGRDGGDRGHGHQWQ